MNYTIAVRHVKTRHQSLQTLFSSAQFECNYASYVSASPAFPFKNQDGKVKCSLKSSGFVAHENLDAINMAIRKETALKLAAGNKPTAALCFVDETVELTGARGVLELLTPLGKGLL